MRDSSLPVEGRAQGDDALAAAGTICAVGEVQLSAAAADVMRARRFGGNLAEQVDVHAVVDGNEVVELCDNEGIVYIVDGICGEERVVVDPVVHILRTESEGPGSLVAVYGLQFIRQAAFLIHQVEGVDKHFRMHAQVLQVRFSDHSAYRIRQAADAELQGRAVRDFFHNHFSDLRIDFVARFKGNGRHGDTAGFDDGCYVGNMDLFTASAERTGHCFVDFYDDLFRFFRNGFVGGNVQAEVKEAVFIHRSNRNHRYVYVEDVAVHRRFVAVAHGDEVHQPLGAQLTVIAAHMPVHSREGFTVGVDFYDSTRRKGKGHTYLDVL